MIQAMRANILKEDRERAAAQERLRQNELDHALQLELSNKLLNKS